LFESAFFDADRWSGNQSGARARAVNKPRENI
jgi:hypothetical protein